MRSFVDHSNPHPPKWALRLFRQFCDPAIVEDIEGDLLERFEQKPSRWLFILEVLMLFRPGIIKKIKGTQKLNHYSMLKNHVKISLRNLIKHRSFTAINIFGLTVGMAIAMLIILFIIDQGGSDAHNANAKDIYRVVTELHDPTEDKDRILATSPYELHKLISLNVSEVDEASQLVKSQGAIQIEKNEFQFEGLFVSPNFLSFFDFELTEGNKVTALGGQSGLVLSERISTKLFRNESPIGQSVKIDKKLYTITGVVDNKAYKSHLSFDVLLPISSFSKKEENNELLLDWESGARIFYNYFRTSPGLTDQSIKTFLSSVDVNISEEKKEYYKFKTQRLDEINLGPLVQNEVGITTPAFVMYFFCVLGLVLILSASFNYMNLAIARGLTRSKEVGVRKVLGAGKHQVILQFLVEAQLVIFISLIAAFLLLQILVPIFNDLNILRDINGAITINFNKNFQVYAVFIVFALTVGVISGAYPAVYLSSFKPVSVLKGSKGGLSPRFLFRKILVFFQYSFSVIFIITGIVLFQQAKIFVTNNYGFEHRNIINVRMSNAVPYKQFRAELLKRKEILGVSAVSAVPVLSSFKEVEMMGRSIKEVAVKSAMLSVDPHVLTNFDLEIVAGRNFSSKLQDHVENTLIINEKALVALGYTAPSEVLNKVIDINSYQKNRLVTSKAEIIGVIKDFDYQFAIEESGPLLLKYDPKTLTTINVKVGEIPTGRGVEIIESIWEKFDTQYPIEYTIYSFELSDINKELAELVNIIGIVAFLAIVIASLGQLSMVFHHVQLKVKETDIRKVLGSSVNSLMFGLARSFLLIVFASVALSTPLAFYINKAWTSKIYNGMEISFFSIMPGIVLVVILALATIYFYVRKAVNINPVDSLKYE